MILYLIPKNQVVLMKRKKRQERERKLQEPPDVNMVGVGMGAQMLQQIKDGNRKNKAIS